MDSMNSPKADTLHIDPKLQARLEALAAKSGVSVIELAETVLRAHADTAEYTQGSMPSATKLAGMSTSERLRRHFTGIGLEEGELVLPERDMGREPPTFS